MAIEIIIDEETRYRITADKYNVVLDRAYFSEKHQEFKYGSNKTYHSDFGAAVQKLVRLEGGRLSPGGNDEIITLETLSEKLQLLEDEVRLMFQQLPDEIMGNIPHKYYLEEAED